MKEKWPVMVLLLVAVLCGYILGQGSILSRAQAQGDSTAGRVGVVIGAERNGILPLFIVDSLEQSVMAYEYRYAGDTLTLKSVRTYRFDKQLGDFHTLEPSVRQVEGMLNR